MPSSTTTAGTGADLAGARSIEPRRWIIDGPRIAAHQITSPASATPAAPTAVSG